MSNEYSNHLQLKGSLTAQDDIKDFLILIQGTRHLPVSTEITRTEDSYQMDMHFQTDGSWYCGVYEQIEQHMKEHADGARAIEAYATYTTDVDMYDDRHRWLFDGQKTEVIETGCNSEFLEKMAVQQSYDELKGMARDIKNKRHELDRQQDALSKAMDVLVQQGAEARSPNRDVFKSDDIPF
jgi:hypothetical protein